MALGDKRYVVVGALQVQANLLAFPFTLQKKIATNVIHKIVKEIALPEAKRLAPYNARSKGTNKLGHGGHLRDSLKVRAIRRTRTRVGRTVQTVPKPRENPRKGAYQEFGTRTSTPRLMYLRKAIYGQEQRIRRKIIKGIAKVVFDEQVSTALAFRKLRFQPRFFS